MPRPPRIEFENAWYHVMNRGAGRRAIFPDNRARELFLKLLSEMNAEFRIEIHAYCLMGNHFHLLVRTPHANLNLAMQMLSSVYTRQHNRLSRTDGPLFKGRYKAILIAEETYLAQVSRYIHRNPVEAELVQHPREYQWSSYSAYCDPNSSPGWLSLNDAVMRVSPRCDRNDYLAFVENPLLASMNKFYHSKQLPGVLGSKEARRLVENHTGYQDKWHPPERLRLGGIVDLVAQSFDVVTAKLMASKRGSLNKERAIAMHLAHSAAKYSIAEIADCFGIGLSGVTQTIFRLKAVINKEPELVQKIEELKQVLVRV